MSARVISRGGALMPSRYGSGEGASVSQLPDGSGRSSSSQPSWVEPLRPECPSCMQSFVRLCACTNSTMRCHASRCASFQIPVQPGEMRPSGDTQVISVKTSPAPPVAREPRCTRCQSPGMPSVGRVLRHRRDDDAVLERHAAQLERQEHRRARRRRRPRAPRAAPRRPPRMPGRAACRFAWPMRWLPVSRL